MCEIINFQDAKGLQSLEKVSEKIDMEQFNDELNTSVLKFYASCGAIPRPGGSRPPVYFIEKLKEYVENMEEEKARNLIHGVLSDLQELVPWNIDDSSLSDKEKEKEIDLLLNKERDMEEIGKILDDIVTCLNNGHNNTAVKLMAMISFL